jgi:hypothetical protein
LGSHLFHFFIHLSLTPRLTTCIYTYTHILTASPRRPASQAGGLRFEEKKRRGGIVNACVVSLPPFVHHSLVCPVVLVYKQGPFSSTIESRPVLLHPPSSLRRRQGHSTYHLSPLQRTAVSQTIQSWYLSPPGCGEIPCPFTRPALI